jgi:hypothetical protein
LTVGPVAITRLVQGCLDAIEERASKQEPVLKMHPADLEMFLNGFDGEPTGVSLVADDRLARGDVSLQIDHSVIDDLLSHRLEEIAQYVFGRSTGDDDLLLDEENESISAEDSMPVDAIEAVVSDPSELAENPSDEELKSPEIESQTDDPVLADEPEDQVLDDSTETQADLDADAFADSSDIDVSPDSDELSEDQIGENDTEIDDTDHSEQ